MIRYNIKDGVYNAEINSSEFIERINNNELEVMEIKETPCHCEIICALVPKKKEKDEFIVTKLIHEYRDHDKVNILVNDGKQDSYYIVHEKGLNVLDNLDKNDLLKFKDRKLARAVCKKLNEVK